MTRISVPAWLLAVALAATGCGPTAVKVLPDYDSKYATMDRIRSDIVDKKETVADLYPEPEKAPAAEAKPVQPAPPAEGAIVAVFDIQDASRKIKPDTLDQLTEYLSTKLTEHAGYRIIPRAQLRARLVEEKRSSYRKCYDQNCQIELGKTMAAQKSLATKILGMGRKCAVTATLYDLKTETTERAASLDTACSQEELMKAMDGIARRLAGSS